MKFLIPILALAAIFTAIPFIRFFCKRLTLASKLKKICKEKNFRIFGMRKLWMLGTKAGKTCDCYIETQNNVYAVKLFSTPSPRSVLVFEDDGTYYFQKKIPMAGGYGGSVEYPKESRHRDFPSYDFRHGYRMEWEIKFARQILLVNPVCREIRYVAKRSGGSKLLGAGDSVNNCQIYSLSRFLGELEGQA